MIFGPPRLEEGDDLIACPCGSTLPFLMRAPRFTLVRRNKRVIRIDTGGDFLCPSCGDTISVGPTGVFVPKHQIVKAADPKPDYKPPADHRPLEAKPRP